MGQARALQPGAIVLDVSVPALDGREAMRRLKLDLKTADIPIVLLTGHILDIDDDPLAAVLRRKPIKSDDLLAAVEAVRRR